MTVIDFKSVVYYGHSIFDKKKKGMSSEYRENGLYSSIGLLAKTRVLPVRPKISRKLQSAKIFLVSSIGL